MNGLKCEIIEQVGTWRAVADSARTTVGKEPGTGEPSLSWKMRILLAEHSPIRQIMFRAKWTNLPYWVSTHLVRHHQGIEHFVKSQRSDRTGEDRKHKEQGAPVTHEILVNASEIIFISRKRLCRQAAAETREAWVRFLLALNPRSPEIASVCVPDCIYRGGCREMTPCGFQNSEEWKTRLEKYNNLIPEKEEVS